MNKSLFLLSFFCVLFGFSQNITVDSQTFTPQQLIEDILIDSNCISNVQVTNSVGGDFNGADQSFGFFDATGTTFPFQSGVVLSTGRLSNVPGPNNSLSDDDAPGWGGDSDLEIALQENDTFNATILEFDFTSTADQISFRYIFASEEYQEGNSNTCNFSDLFGFLIRPVTGQDYENIAIIPNTQTPVKVTTVHSGIPGACDPINETYFESWNPQSNTSTSPINFNGQTVVLTATATTIPNETYHVKLVIADEFNERFDSAVFLEAGSFELNTDLGPDRIFANQNPVCENDTVTLNAFEPGMSSYKWFKDGIEDLTETNATFLVTDAGTYNVEITLDNGCISYGEITIEYATNPIVFNTTLIECDIDLDGFTTYNLFNASNTIINGNNDLSITNFYTNFMDAEILINEIVQPDSFNNTSVLQTVYANVVDTVSGCTSIAEVILDISTNTLTVPDVFECDDDIIDSLTTFDLNAIATSIEPLIPLNSNITFYNTLQDAFSETNSISGSYLNTTPITEVIFVKVKTDTNDCYAITSFSLNVLFTPQIAEDESFLYCLNTFPDTLTLVGGILNDSPSNYYYQWLFNGTDTGVNTSFIDVNEIGTYTVIATDPNGCSNTRDIIVFASNEPIIDNLVFTELTTNNTATITVSGEGDYEFALDNENGFYQDDNTFNGIEPGIHTIYIRDKMGCGDTASIEFSILGFPQFFTPNGDTFNETWKPIGTSEQFNSDLKINIFNRYGQLLSQIDPVTGWNGTLNGFKLPSDDYWYIINHPNGTEYRGHFTLKR